MVQCYYTVVLGSVRLLLDYNTVVVPFYKVQEPPFLPYLAILIPARYAFTTTRVSGYTSGHLLSCCQHLRLVRQY